MSTADVFMSSPPRPARFDPYAISSSSPYLPSIDELFSKSQKRPSLRSESHVAPIPANARTTFTSAASLLRDAPEIDIETEQITQSPPRKPKSNRGRKKKVASPERAPFELGDAPVLLESVSPKEKPWQKFSSKSKEPVSLDEQQTLPKGRVTKAIPKTKPRRKAETMSRHFANKKVDAARSDDETGRNDGKYGETLEIDPASISEAAMARRGTWTPPRPDSLMILDSDSDARELLSSIDKAATSKDVFHTLFDQYSLKDDTPSVGSGQQPQAEFLKKRKLIELLSTTHDAPARETSPLKVADKTPVEPKPKKAPAVKKKARTITDLAMAPYALPIEPEQDIPGPATKDSLLKYFDADGDVQALVEHQTSVMSQKKGKGKATKQPARPKRKTKKGTVADPILLSPSSALKQHSNQDFIFGTSSQLVREESPTTLKDLHLAIQTSNQVDSDPFGESDSHGLWHAGARDMDGELMDLEMVDLRQKVGVAQEHTEDGRALQMAEDFVDIDDILTSSITHTNAAQSTASPKPENSHFFQSQPTSNVVPSESGTSESSKQSTSKPRPKYELFTDAQLAKQITSFGFKPVKKRQAMITLLGQCWASKNEDQPNPTSASSPSPPKKQRTVVAPTKKPAKPRGRPKKIANTEVSTVVASTSETPSPPKPRGRPKKTAPKAVEIADSDMDELDSPSPTSSPDRIFSSPPPVDLSTSDEADMSLTMSPTDQQAHLFTLITKSVKSAPRSTDPSNPSWHEKMLLFDPIILEDLASWLNGGELTRVGYDEEVSPSDVKKWCESKSVICLWRANFRGKERKRY
ncbi:Uu.00g034870.m01.CDS01 [Anthostomella pinea]|uniref:Structure-specific endonuclease subunit SLX4 n=1 Tax=Anthostomella pinea TaxID=933095 RepID=A0AAI8V903_9PEZI|nr:Uu.00g034870.m01.CDS01 [Anthostomella pinea]